MKKITEIDINKFYSKTNENIRIKIIEWWPIGKKKLKKVNYKK